MEKEISRSEFYMWRTLFAVAHADDVVTDEEIQFMAKILEDVSFNDAQTAILKDDIVNAKNVEQMFDGITDEQDRTRFFSLARDLVWVDGDFGAQEQSVMVKLHTLHVGQSDVDTMVGNVDLEFEKEEQEALHMSEPCESVHDVLARFKKWFTR